MEQLIVGQPLYLVRDGKFSLEDFDKEGLSQDEFFAEISIANAEHLGQVKNAVMETCGNISILYFSDREVKPALLLIPIFTSKNSKTLTQKEAIPVLIAAIR